MTDASESVRSVIRSVIVRFCLVFLWYEFNDELSASVWFVLLVVANESSSSNGVHCNGVRMFHDNPALLQPPHERERVQCFSQPAGLITGMYSIFASEQRTRQSRQKEAARVPVWMTGVDATYGNSIKS